MAFLHCHNCGWQQDDFWSASYNPLRRLLTYEAELLAAPIDAVLRADPEFFTDNPGVKTLRDLIAGECERSARIIRNMVYRTAEQLKAEHGRALGPCPKCGHETLDVD